MNFTRPSELCAPGRWRKRYPDGLPRSTDEGSTRLPDVSTTSMLLRSRNPGSRMTDGSVSFCSDAGRHVPVRTEDEVRHLVVEDRGLGVRLADDDFHRQRHLVRPRRRPAASRECSRGCSGCQGRAAASASAPCSCGSARSAAGPGRSSRQRLRGRSPHHRRARGAAETPSLLPAESCHTRRVGRRRESPRENLRTRPAASPVPPRRASPAGFQFQRRRERGPAAARLDACGSRRAPCEGRHTRRPGASAHASDSAIRFCLRAFSRCESESNVSGLILQAGSVRARSDRPSARSDAYFM